MISKERKDNLVKFLKTYILYMIRCKIQIVLHPTMGINIWSVSLATAITVNIFKNGISEAYPHATYYISRTSFDVDSEFKKEFHIMSVSCVMTDFDGS